MMQRQPPRGETSFLIYTPPDFYYKTELAENPDELERITKLINESRGV